MSVWKRIEIKELSTLITKGTTPTTIGSGFTSQGINFIKAESITRNGEIDSSTFAKIDFKTHEVLKRSQLCEEDVLVSIAGIYLGKIGLVKKEHIPANTNQAVALIRVIPSKLLAKFLKYFLLIPSTTIYLNALCPQSAQPNLNLSQLGKVKIPLLPLLIQRKIAAILSAYDDLIENNNRRIAILEKMAEELYREWFVRLRFPGHESVKIVKGVPEGWEVKKLCDVLELAYGKALKEEDRIGGKYPVYGSGGIIGYHNKAMVKGPGIVVGRKGSVGSIFWSNNDFYPIDTTYYVKSEYPFEYLYYLLHSMNFINNDAAVPGLNREQAYANIFFFPNKEIIGAFISLIKSIWEQKHIFGISTSYLVASRDRLLTRLMSGKIDVEHLDIQFPASMKEEA